MEYKIRTYKNEEGIFAEILNEKGENVCIADGITELSAIGEVCLVFSDIIEDFEKTYFEVKDKILNEYL